MKAQAETEPATTSLPESDEARSNAKYWASAAVAAACIAVGIVGHKRGWFKKAAEEAKTAVNKVEEEVKGTAGKVAEETEVAAGKIEEDITKVADDAEAVVDDAKPNSKPPVRNFRSSRTVLEIQNGKIYDHVYDLENGSKVSVGTTRLAFEPGKLTPSVQGLDIRDKAGIQVYSLNRNVRTGSGEEIIYDRANNTAILHDFSDESATINRVPTMGNALIREKGQWIAPSEFTRIRSQILEEHIPPNNRYIRLRKNFIDTLPEASIHYSMILNNGNRFSSIVSESNARGIALSIPNSNLLQYCKTYNKLDKSLLEETFEQNFKTYTKTPEAGKYAYREIEKQDGGNIVTDISKEVYSEARNSALERLLDGAQDFVRAKFGL